ncbi:MAG: branched-chain amino acid ABC transporter permease [Aeromicrobium sp.]|uniref:branched-chain amino acid ABC transporter permease n=1 Tax=Aeromicrobium sp. TaxID=1871063 RepID=UPI0039E6026E
MAASATTTPSPAEDYSDTGYAISVALVDSANAADGEPAPVEGVTISVTDQSGAEIGREETDEDGKVDIPLPGKGTYVVHLDAETLPKDAELSGSATSEPQRVMLKTPKSVQFQIGVGEVEKDSFASRFQTSLISGVKFGLIIALAALGLSLIFGTTGLTNFSHGELITFGAIMTYVFNQGFGLPVILAGVLAVVAGAAFGWAQDAALWRPLRRRGTGVIAMMIVSIGLGLLLRNVFQYAFGDSTRSYSEYTTQQRQDYGFISLAPKEIGIIVISVAVIALVCVGLMKTRLGKATRAVSDNPALSASSGLRVDGVIRSVWVLGAALSALAGVLLGVNSQVNFLSGYKLLLLVFAAVTLGGLGTIWGALLGSLVIGIMTEVGPLFGVPGSIKEVGALVVLIVVLLVRPQGILGRKQRIG